MMILHELYGTENHPNYITLESENSIRQYDFLLSVIKAAVSASRPMISTTIINALNYHAIACLHSNPGIYRPCEMHVNGRTFPPAHYRVPTLMDHFINEVNLIWQASDAWALSAYCLWKLNQIHPFINGNGRTARALCYFVICVKCGGALPGYPTLPQLMYSKRKEYIQLLRETDIKFESGDDQYLNGLSNFIEALIQRQIQSSVLPQGGEN